MIRNFLDRGTAALLTVLPDRHDVIECISTASQFYILEAIKVVLNKPIDHFHLRLLLTLLPWVHHWKRQLKPYSFPLRKNRVIRVTYDLPCQH